MMTLDWLPAEQNIMDLSSLWLPYQRSLIGPQTRNRARSVGY